MRFRSQPSGQARRASSFSELLRRRSNRYVPSAKPSAAAPASFFARSAAAWNALAGSSVGRPAQSQGLDSSPSPRSTSAISPSSPGRSRCFPGSISKRVASSQRRTIAGASASHRGKSLFRRGRMGTEPSAGESRRLVEAIVPLRFFGAGIDRTRARRSRPARRSTRRACPPRWDPGRDRARGSSPGFRVFRISFPGDETATRS